MFCEQYARWRSHQDLVLRQNHTPGEKVFVDYAGQTVPIVDRYSGESAPAQIFVAVLGCSNYTYICATRTQSLADWLAAHVQMLEFFGGVPVAAVPDNLKSAVKRAHRYEPQLNPSYQDFAEHYGLAILPARVRKPRDKAKVEGGVLIVERWILARLRNRTFFSLGELNSALAELLVSLNTRPSRSSPAPDTRGSWSWINPRCGHSHCVRMSLASGRKPKSIRTTTSRSVARTTRCRTASSASGSTYA